MTQKMHELDMMLDLQLQGRNEEAWALSEKLEKIGPDKIHDITGKHNPEMWLRHCFNRGWFLYQQGDYQQGSKLLENGRFLSVYGNGLLKTDKPIYNPETNNIKGKSIIISLEGGYGDEIIHARFAQSYKKLGADKVYLAAAPELKTLFERIPGVDGVIQRDQPHTVNHDYWVPGFSAGWIAGHTFDDIPNDPYIFAQQSSVKLWENIIKSDKPKIGIRWAGNPKFEHQQFRKFPEEFITNLYKYKDHLALYSLQRDNNVVNLPEGIVDLQHLLISWEDTAAAIKNLDLVITSCTSIAHLAGALGVPTWVVVPALPYHTWAYKSPHSTSSPYYKTVTLYRQEKFAHWNEAFQKLYRDLEKKFDLAAIEMPNEDRKPLKLNMHCGSNKLQGFVNVDPNKNFDPDIIYDLSKTPWAWKNDEFTYIRCDKILNQMGDSDTQISDIIKEMYRVSSNGAVWEVIVPYWNHNAFFDTFKNKRVISPIVFNNFNKKLIHDKLKNNIIVDDFSAFEHDVDIDVCDVQYKYDPFWEEKLKAREVTEDQLKQMMMQYNNIVLEIRILIEVHKIPRYNKSDVLKYLQC